ncbi:MAG: Gfo/Idh/MocA family protein [Candidatus Berkiella sp.]
MSVKYNYSDVQIAVIGCGNWGKNLIRVYHELGALKAICDTDPLKMAHFQQQYGISCGSFTEILASDVDAVVIATPSATHFELARLALLANKHVFIEKPMAHQLEQANQLQQLAKQRGRCLMVGHLLQYHPGYLKLKALKNEGVFGEIQSVHATRFNFGKFPTEESVLWDYAPHDVSMILGLFEALPTKVLATNENPLSHTSADTTTIHLHFADNKKARVISSWVHPFKEQKLMVTGDKAIALFDDCQAWENKLTLFHYPETWNDGLPQPFIAQKTIIPLLPAEPLKNECKHFLQAILTQSEPITGAFEALNVTTVLTAAIQSIATENVINLKEKQTRTAIPEGIYA